MTWQLVWTGPALKDMDGLDANHARRIHAAFTGLAHTPPHPSCPERDLPGRVQRAASSTAAIR